MGSGTVLFWWDGIGWEVRIPMAFYRLLDPWSGSVWAGLGWSRPVWASLSQAEPGETDLNQTVPT